MKNKNCKTFKEIYQAVDKGEAVHWQSGNYTVIMKFDEYRIKASTGKQIGIYEPDFKPNDFFVAEV